MKKLSTLLLSLLLSSFLVATQYKITNVDFNITAAGFKFLGKTNETSLLIQYPIDKTTVFQTQEEFEKYINNYLKELEDSRFFDSINYTLEEIQSTAEPNLTEIAIFITIIDSHHFLTMPYPKYSSNDGFQFKLKVKDTNFLGSLNTLTSDINFEVDTSGNISPGFSLAYDFPFQLGKVNCEWINDYTISYTTGNSMPEWELTTGFSFYFPFQKIGLRLEAYQYFINELDYEYFNDNMYFSEELILSLPIPLYTFENFTKLDYTPYISTYYNWDFDSIHPYDDDLASPNLTFGHSLSNSKVSWNNCFRSGYNVSLSNSFSYNFPIKDFSPYIGFETQLFYNFITSENRNFLDQFGICFDFYVFGYLYCPSNVYVYGEQIGSRLRGILDNSFFGNESPSSTCSSAFMFSLDLPHHMFTTNFPIEIINFNFQIAPFIDVALIYNRRDNKVYSIKDGLYCAGVEFLVYPLKWSSYTVRASAGYDVKNLLKGEGSILSKLKHPELYIGLGLQF